jgi:plasmid stabilization system protein ParE
MIALFDLGERGGRDDIRHQPPTNADKVAARLKPLIAMLPACPWIGRPSQIPGLRVRTTRPYPYLIVYKVGGEHIVTLRHAVQDPGLFPDL